MTEPETTTDEILRLTETIGAPPEAVFEFLVDPEKMVRWMGTEVRLEPRPGGEFWANVTGTDIAIGTYLEVDPPRRVVFSWGWEGSEDVPPASSTVTITLTPDGDGTLLELAHAGLPGGAGDNHAHGWTHFLGRLSAVMIGADPGSNHPDPNHSDSNSPDSNSPDSSGSEAEQS